VVDVGAGGDDVVAARADGDQVRPCLQCDRELLVDDLAQCLAANGEIGVREAGVVLGEHLCEAVGPAAERAVRQFVVHTLGEAVAQGHEAGEPMHAESPFSFPAGHCATTSRQAARLVAPLRACADDVENAGFEATFATTGNPYRRTHSSLRTQAPFLTWANNVARGRAELITPDRLTVAKES